MIMIESLIAIFSSSGVGAITGGIFGWLNRREDRKIRLADQEHERSMVGLKSAAEVKSSEARAFEESQKTLSKFGDAVKSAVRPIVTACLMYMTYEILISLEKLVGGLTTLPPEDAVSLYKQITLSIISLTSMAISWWFASRPTGINLGR